jgi:hypothetical protein
MKVERGQATLPDLRGSQSRWKTHLESLSIGTKHLNADQLVVRKVGLPPPKLVRLQARIFKAHV